jgi:galactitol-specific phosphotransferase system IIB component
MKYIPRGLMMYIPRPVLIACGGGTISSHIAKHRIQDRLKAYGIRNVTIIPIPYIKAQLLSRDAVVFINLSPNDGIEYACPVVNGIPFLSGFGIDKAMLELKAALEVDTETR